MNSIHHFTARTEAARLSAMLAFASAKGLVMPAVDAAIDADCGHALCGDLAIGLAPVAGSDRAAISSRPMGEQQGQEWAFIASSLRSVEMTSVGNYGTQAKESNRVRSGRGELRH